ncbi:MAG: hypothetical protein K5756_05430 [Clostridiales bacterium]|nr:hypothetical protein [Clostridiales bacterium]
MNSTRIKNFFAILCKIMISGLIAFAVLTLICCLYYNLPVHSEDKDGAADYKWKPGMFYSRGTEGFAAGRINNDGFNDPFDYKEGMEISTLVMGSSQMEAFNVGQKESTAAQLGQLMKDKTVYNIGVSGHNLLTCVCNLEKALEKYRPSDCVVIETGNIRYSVEDLTAALEGTLPEITARAGGILGLLQRNQYLRLLYMQLSNYKDGAADNADTDTAPEKTEAADPALNGELLDKLMKKVSAAAAPYGIKVIIVYHPEISIAPDGGFTADTDAEALEVFKKSCAENGVVFSDMTEPFRNAYLRDSTLPYGFTNTSVGKGHLNKYGHAMVAEELYKLISEVN